MLNLSSALGRLVLSGRELARLSGFSSRVTGLIDVIDDVNRGVYKRGHQPNIPEKVAAKAQGAAAAVAIEAQHTAQARISSSHRNAGIAGVNLAAEHTPKWIDAGRKTPSGVSTNQASSSATLPVIVGGDLPSSTSGKLTEEGVVVSGRSDSGTQSLLLAGQPELAPEGSVAGEVAMGDGGGGASAGNGGVEVQGGDQLQRSGSILVNENSVIEFTDVPLVTPTGEVLIEALSFKVNILILGGHVVDQFSVVGPGLRGCVRKKAVGWS